ncbi:MAG: crosslink repair DNA glycosylase YcaQ family protein [Planctomycetota bacterium]
MPQTKMTADEFRIRMVAGSFPKYRSLSEALDCMGFIQADPIRSPARAQDLVLRQRVRGYRAGNLEKQYSRIAAEEGYLFAYGFMTHEVWRHLRYRPFRALSKIERQVLDAIAELGEVHSRGLDGRFERKSVINYWGGRSQETKQVLEQLHHHGYLRVCRRDNGIRVYEVPSEARRPFGSGRRRYRFLALTTALQVGPVTQRFLLSELRSHNHLVPKRADRLAIIASLIDDGELEELTVGDTRYLWRKERWESRETVKTFRVLAPFDPLVRDRDRFLQLFGWAYRFEAYVPASRRQRGYYAMPVLYGNQIIGWANAKAENASLKLELGYTNGRPRARDFRKLAEEEAESMVHFLGLDAGSWEIQF